MCYTYMYVKQFTCTFIVRILVVVVAVYTFLARCTCTCSYMYLHVPYLNVYWAFESVKYDLYDQPTAFRCKNVLELLHLRY